jgi:hypothetical protein
MGERKDPKVEWLDMNFASATALWRCTRCGQTREAHLPDLKEAGWLSCLRCGTNYWVRPAVHELREILYKLWDLAFSVVALVPETAASPVSLPVKVVGNDLRCFPVDPVTLEPRGPSVYDPYALTDPEPGIVTMGLGEWEKKRFEMRYPLED